MIQIIWDMPDDPEGNVQHIAQLGLSEEDVEGILLDAANTTSASRTSGMPITFGETADGRYVAVVWEHVLDDPLTIRPITAYDAPRPSRRRRR